MVESSDIERRRGMLRCARLLVAVAAAAPGCSMQMTITPGLSKASVPASAPPTKLESNAPANPQPQKNSDRVATKSDGSPEYLPDSLIDAGSLIEKEAPPTPASPKSSVVNVFGEFSQARKGPRMLAADLALKQHTFTDSGYDTDVSVDPAARTMVYASARGGEATQLFLQRFDSPSLTQLTGTTAGSADDGQPCFSPDGKRIAFASNRTGRWQIYAMGIDGRNVVQLTHGEANDMHPSFSPDGTRLVYSSLPTAGGGAGEQWQLWTIDLVSRQQKMVGYGLFPAWSPERKRDVIAFQKTRAKGSRWFSLWTCELRNNDEGDPESAAITEIAVSTNAALVSPTWSPDGSRLAFVSIVEPAQTKDGKPQGQQDIWSIDADGSNRKRLSDGTAMNLLPCWAVDNRVYFVSDRSGHECIWSLPTPQASGNSDGTQEKTARKDAAPTARPAPKPREEPGDKVRDESMAKEPPKDQPGDSTTAANEPAEIKP